MSDAWLESCGLKKRQKCEPVADALDRLDLFEDLLEEDTSVFPLLDVPPEVLTTVGIFLDARHLTTLSQLNAQAQPLLDDALADAWTELLLRDFETSLGRSRAKRYKFGETQRCFNASAGLVLTAVDQFRVEWDGFFVAAPAHLRYRLFHTMHVLKGRWGRLAQSWEWFATRALHRLTFDQLQRCVPGFTRPAQSAENAEEFDEVLHQATLDRDLRQRHTECNPKDVIASMKKSLGIATAAIDGADGTAPQSAALQNSATECSNADDMLSALAPTARDQRVQQAEAERVNVALGEQNAQLEMPSQEVVERMTFSEQLELALRVSQASEAERVTDAAPPKPQTTPKCFQPQQPAAAAATDTESGNDVLLRLKGRARSSQEPLEVVMRAFTVGEALAIPEQLRRPLEQVALRLTRGNWLLFYEGLAAEAQLRARAVAAQFRSQWPSAASAEGEPVRTRGDLEAELLQLAILRGRNSGRQSEPTNSSMVALRGSREEVEREEKEKEERLENFLQAWREHEAWTVALEEHLGPLDLEVGRERTHNLQRGKAHTPYAADVCRLAFRNFAICEARLFFRLALAVYALIARLSANRSSLRGLELLEDLCSMAEEYMVQDDALATQRSTLQEYRYYLLEPLQRARKKLLPDAGPETCHDAEEDGFLVRD